MPLNPDTLHRTRLRPGDDLTFVTDLMRTAFPVCEQRSRPQIEAALVDPAYHLVVMSEGAEPEAQPDVEPDAEPFGFISYWMEGDYLYVEHLAIAEKHRGRRLGTIFLHDLKRLGRKILLEIDPRETDIARRRAAFYERQGFLVNEHLGFHGHPPYRVGFEPHRLELLSYDPAGVPLTASERETFLTMLRTKCMAVEADEG